MYQSQQISTDLCRDFYVHPTQLFTLWWILVWDPDCRSSKGGVLISQYSVPCVAPVMYYFRTSRRLAEHLYPVLLHTNFITIKLSGLCCIRYRVFPLKTPAFILTVQWVASPLCTYTLYCVPYKFTRVLRFQNDQFCIHLVVYVSLSRGSISDLTFHNKILTLIKYTV
jgi:hypothetical protein